MREGGRQAGVAGEGRRKDLDWRCSSHVFMWFYLHLLFYKTRFFSSGDLISFALEKLACYCLEHYVSEASCFFLSQLKEAGDLLLGTMRNNWHFLLSRRHLR